MPEESHPVTHTCGYRLMQIASTQVYDITSISDIPEHMQPKFVPNVGYVGGVSFSDLPLAYHKFMSMPSRIWWEDDGQKVIDCPSCQGHLQVEDMQN